MLFKLEPRNPEALNGRAWFQATCPVAKYRDGTKALAMAKQACELAEWKIPGLLDTLAACYAESGDFDNAVKWQTRAIEIEADAQEKDRYNTRLKLYTARKPFHQTES